MGARSLTGALGLQKEVNMKYVGKVNLFSDGGSKGNPGPGSIAILICCQDNKLLHEYSECIGHCTNNQAEYKALIKGLDYCAKYTRGDVVCFSDSELIIKHMNGQYRLKNDELRSLYHDVVKNANVFKSVTYQHVPRTNQRIQRADKLVKQAHEGRCINKTHNA